jgi:hypothetical protein
MNQAHSSKSEQGLAPYYYLWAYSNDTQNEPDGWIRPFSIVDTQQWHGERNKKRTATRESFGIIAEIKFDHFSASLEGQFFLFFTAFEVYDLRCAM